MARHAKATGPKSPSCLGTRPRWRVNLPLERSTLSTLAQARLHQSRRSIHRPRATRRQAAARGKPSDRVHVPLMHQQRRYRWHKKEKKERENFKKIFLKEKESSSWCNVSCEPHSIGRSSIIAESLQSISADQDRRKRWSSRSRSPVRYENLISKCARR